MLQVQLGVPVPTWRNSPRGYFWADLGSLRLVVHASDLDGRRVWFSVLRRQRGRGSPFALAASGAENDQLAAMDAAEALAPNAGASLRVLGRAVGTKVPTAPQQRIAARVHAAARRDAEDIMAARMAAAGHPLL